MKETIRFAFQDLRLRRLDSEINVENVASNNFLKRLVFCLEGTRIEYRRMKSTGKIHDVYTYGLLK